MQVNDEFQVAIIGAGPSGSCIASLLHDQGIKSVVFERDEFPRFSIGESLLPQCSDDLSKAGLLEGIEQQNYQFKNGAAFVRGDDRATFDFSEKFTPGLDYAYEVKRADFDKNLADQCTDKGIQINYSHQVNDVRFEDDMATVSVKCLKSNCATEYKVNFVVDASGFGRVLPRLLDLNMPVDSPSRSSLFTHIKDDFSCKIDRDKILIVVNNNTEGVWYWVIPFSDGTVSLGVVAETDKLNIDLSDEQQFIELLDDCPEIIECLDYKGLHREEVKKIQGYACGVKALHGDSYVLLGNAGEFIDPVFSSGVTIAIRSACLAAPLIAKQLSGEKVDWQLEYSAELTRGVEVFRSFVDFWYSGELMNLFLANHSNKSVKKMICSILAGYAWDPESPIVKHPKRRVKALIDWVEMQA